MPVGHLLLLLHAHLPFVRHPEEPVFLEEGWLFEAITETYIPLLERLDRMLREGVPARLTMTWSPPLCEMLADPLLQSRYRAHVGKLLELAEQEVPAKANTPFAEAAVMYRDHFRFCLSVLDRFQGNVLAWVRQLADAGVVEPITCGATHGFLPLMMTTEGRRAQLAVAVANYRKHFGRDPKGIWLPECGYTPGLEDLLKEQGIRFFFVDTHGIYYGDPRPRYGVYAPVFTRTGVAAFGRDVHPLPLVIGRQVMLLPAVVIGLAGHPAGVFPRRAVDPPPVAFLVFVGRAQRKVAPLGEPGDELLLLGRLDHREVAAHLLATLLLLVPRQVRFECLVEVAVELDRILWNPRLSRRRRPCDRGGRRRRSAQQRQAQCNGEEALSVQHGHLLLSGT